MLLKPSRINPNTTINRPNPGITRTWNNRGFPPSASETGDDSVDHTLLIYPPDSLITDRS